MSKFKVGQELIIYEDLRGRAVWYTDDIYFVTEIHPEKKLYLGDEYPRNEWGYHSLDEEGFNKNLLLVLRTIDGRKLRATESKFKIPPVDRIRDIRIEKILYEY